MRTFDEFLNEASKQDQEPKRSTEELLGELLELVNPENHVASGDIDRLLDIGLEDPRVNALANNDNEMGVIGHFLSSTKSDYRWNNDSDEDDPDPHPMQFKEKFTELVRKSVSMGVPVLNDSGYIYCLDNPRTHFAGLPNTEMVKIIIAHESSPMSVREKFLDAVVSWWFADDTDPLDEHEYRYLRKLCQALGLDSAKCIAKIKKDVSELNESV